jgi:hypothetical protein
MLVQPLVHVVQVNVEPSSERAFPVAPEGDLQVFLSTIVAQCQPNAREDIVLIASMGIEIPKQAGVKWNAKPALVEHVEAAERRNGIRVQMDQLTPDLVQDRDKKFARWKAMPAYQMRLETSNVGSIDRGKIQNCGGTNQHPWKPAGVMVGGDVHVCHHWRLPILVQQGDLLSSIA